MKLCEEKDCMAWAELEVDMDSETVVEQLRGILPPHRITGLTAMKSVNDGRYCFYHNKKRRMKDETR